MNRSPKLSKLLWISLLASTALALGGCQLIGYIAAQLAPPEKVKPKYEVPKDKKVLIFVESVQAQDPEQPMSYEIIKSDLTQRLEAQFKEHGVAQSFVSQVRLQNLLDGTRDPNIEIGTIGQKLGADLVFYVKIEDFRVFYDQHSLLWTSHFQATVRVIDPRVGKVWPKDQSEFPMPPIELQPSDASSPTFGTLLAEQLSVKMADRIAKLFYEYEIPKNGDKTVRNEAQ